MKDITIWILAAVFGACSAGLAAAGEMENLSLGAEKSFAGPFMARPALFAPEAGSAAEVKAVSAGAAEYRKLAAAFAKGTAPKKEELDGWNAGRFLGADFPDYPGSLLLSSVSTQTASGAAPIWKLIPSMLDAGPSFYETIEPDIAAGIALVIQDQLPMWTTPVFTKTEVSFEKVMPSYDRGFSRFAVRKAADGRILLRKVSKSEIYGPAGEETVYGYLTKNVTPKQ